MARVAWAEHGLAWRICTFPIFLLQFDIYLRSCTRTLTLLSSARSKSASSACFSKICLWTNRLCPPQSLSLTPSSMAFIECSSDKFFTDIHTCLLCPAETDLAPCWAAAYFFHSFSGGWSTTCVLLFQGGFMCYPPGNFRRPLISFCGETSMCPLTFPTLLSNRGGPSESNRK